MSEGVPKGLGCYATQRFSYNQFPAASSTARPPQGILGAGPKNLPHPFSQGQDAMTDEELISPEDLSRLRILSKIDHRAEDSWAHEDAFVEAFLKHVGCQSLKYSSLIRHYWREK